MKRVACPLCGQVPRLPAISPEELHFRASFTAPKRGPVLPDGDLAVECGGTIYAVPAEDWRKYTDMRAAACVQPAFEAA